MEPCTEAATSAAMASLGSEIQAVVRQLVSEEVAKMQQQIKEQFALLEQALRFRYEKSMALFDEAQRLQRPPDIADTSEADARRAGAARPIEGKICLEVGDTKFFTTADVLCGRGHPDPSTRGSYLALLLTGRWQQSFFVARSPVSFSFVLEYLTYHTLYNHPKDMAGLALLIRDADFYGLKELHASLSFSVNSWRGAGCDGGERRWNQYHCSSGLRAISAHGTKLEVHHPGIYLIYARDLQTQNGGKRMMTLLRDSRALAKSYMYTYDGSVSTQLACMVYLTQGTGLSVHCDALDEVDDEASCSSMIMLRLDGRFSHASWRLSNGQFQRLCQRPFQAHADTNGIASEVISVEQTGKYLLAAQVLQTIAEEKHMHLYVNDEEVASSYVNTGENSRSACATAFLMQLLDLSEGDKLKLECEDPVESDSNSIFMVQLPKYASCASWQAQTSEFQLEWNFPLFEHEDFRIDEDHKLVQLIHDGLYLVMVRTVAHGDDRKMFQLLQNSSPIATSYVTTDGNHRNCAHIVEVVQALAGDTLSIVHDCDFLDDVVKKTYTNLSILMLTKTYYPL
mmetsp:Transcript_37177/g.104901  ORF Transcript_37177/g.104901 Transcript_37177/m.104901 type:complete len:568 (-) Transcript_37177:98-1801(-)|eukprot:CAMPEP_0179213830 /NCGR_PEP_ID=MMETSP0797-20121207/1914_1 /TAXON_ID=47934 /ORGANISM="Dinophysis acuminata, Strain DAEP01" /LENGTH=567 /DNA_ID=CAMNT_0020919667 /DNA_START=1 /DNA_END=1704 /DNA_ORIENTATION=+